MLMSCYFPVQRPDFSEKVGKKFIPSPSDLQERASVLEELRLTFLKTGDDWITTGERSHHIKFLDKLYTY